MDKPPRRQTRSSKSKEKVIRPAENEGTDLLSKPHPKPDLPESDESESDLNESVPPDNWEKTAEACKPEPLQASKPEPLQASKPEPLQASKPPKKNKDPPETVDGRTEKVQREGPKGNYNMYILVILSIPCILAAFTANNYLDRTDNIDIEDSLQQLASDFQSQSPYSFKKIESRALTYLRHKTSPQPFVLMVASMPDDQPTADCFVNHVAKLLTTTSVAINGSKYSDTKSDDAKLEIDDRLRNIFQEGKFPTAAVIHNLDLIPYGTTSLFYAYCDHDNPMYKEAAIIFTITLPQSYELNADELDRERLVEKYLAEDSPWVNDEAFSLDVMGALISRITDIVIVVNKESRESLEKLC